MINYVLVLLFFLMAVESVILQRFDLVKDYVSISAINVSVLGFLISILMIILRRLISRKKLHLKIFYKKIVVSAACGIAAFNLLMFSFNTFVNLNITRSEIEQTFLKNIDDFDAVAKYLIKQQGNIQCYNVDGKIEMISYDKDYKETKITVSDEKINEKLDRIFRKLDYKSIQRTDHEVVFLLHEVVEVNGYDEGIAYIESDEIIEGNLVNQSYSKIIDNWYYCFTGYV